jgi:hypothetical protein
MLGMAKAHWLQLRFGQWVSFVLKNLVQLLPQAPELLNS